VATLLRMQAKEVIGKRHNENVAAMSK